MDPSYFLLFAPLHLHSLSTITSLIKQGKHKTRSHKTRSEITQVFREENKEDRYSNPSLPLDILFPNKHSPKLSLLGQRTYWLLTPGWPGQKRMPPPSRHSSTPAWCHFPSRILQSSWGTQIAMIWGSTNNELGLQVAALLPLRFAFSVPVKQILSVRFKILSVNAAICKSLKQSSPVRDVD